MLLLDTHESVRVMVSGGLIKGDEGDRIVLEIYLMSCKTASEQLKIMLQCFL